jgi:hypothetical protein
MSTYLDLEAFYASVSSSSSVFTNLPAASGDTLTVRSLSETQKAILIDFGAYAAAANIVRVRSPYLHDDVNGIRSRYLAADPSGLTGFTPNQLLRPQDTLIVESTGTGSAAGVTGWLLNYYDGMPGGPSIYINARELESRTLEETSTEVAVTSGAAGVWGSALLSAGTGILKANQLYAIYGYELDVACTAVGLYGPDTGNFRAGGPGVTTRQFTRNFFTDMSEQTGLPTIPVVNAQNASGTNVQVIHYTGSTAVNVNLLMARLK